MRVRYDGDEGIDEGSTADDNNFDFDESLLVRASDMLPSTVAASALNMIPLMPIEDELITKPWLKPKKPKPANGVKPKTINRVNFQKNFLVFFIYFRNFLISVEDKKSSIDTKMPKSIS